jgi:antitoxin component of RelBE/YafQ-DinJ toxin-antitoxin module
MRSKHPSTQMRMGFLFSTVVDMMVMSVASEKGLMREW